MRKNEEQLAKRRALIQLALNNPEIAAQYLENAALTLRSCKRVSDIIDCMSNVLFLSDRTIEYDLSANIDIKLIKDCL